MLRYENSCLWYRLTLSSLKTHFPLKASRRDKNCYIKKRCSVEDDQREMNRFFSMLSINSLTVLTIVFVFLFQGKIASRD